MFSIRFDLIKLREDYDIIVVFYLFFTQFYLLYILLKYTRIKILPLHLHCMVVCLKAYKGLGLHPVTTPLMVKP